MKKLHVATSPLTNRIYAGSVIKNGQTWGANKADVTGAACGAVAEHVLRNGEPVTVTCNGVPKFEITVRDLTVTRTAKETTMFDPDDYELKHARKMARERDEARVMVDRLTAELDECAAALPGAYYMDPPDGGDVPVSEQLRRMAKDAERYRYLRQKVAIAGAAAEFDSALDAERIAQEATRPPTPAG